MNIGKAQIRGNLILAPLAGYTDRAFRQIATEWGADCAVTEMISAEGLARDGEKTKELLCRFDGEEELIYQIFGYSEDQFRRCLPSLLTFCPTIIDINCGCPVNKVVKTGAGSALMAHPETIYKMVRVIKEGTDTPVSVKFRLGWNQDQINYLEFASAAVEAGADMLTMHSRTRAQGYSGKANQDELKKLKEHFPSTIIFGSGDVLSPEDALNIKEYTGVDGLMFARGAIGNPFIFKQTKQLLETGSYDEISIEERVETMKRHLSLMLYYLGERKAIVDIRKHIAGYIKGCKNSSKVKQEAMCAKSRDEYFTAFDHLLDRN